MYFRFNQGFESLILAMLMVSLLAACVHAPPLDAPAVRVSEDYLARGDARGVRPFIYGKSTIIEVHDAPYFFTVKDIDGKVVAYDRNGRYYHLERSLDHFTVSLPNRTILFEPAKPQALLPDLRIHEMEIVDFSSAAEPATSQTTSREAE